MEIVQLERLLQCEHLLGSIVARQCGLQRRVRGGTAHVAMGGQGLRGALARDDGAEMRIPVTLVISVTAWWNCRFICINAFACAECAPRTR
jgi:hypothetical protein